MSVDKIVTILFYTSYHANYFKLSPTMDFFVSAILWSIGFEIHYDHSIVPLKVNLSK